MLGWSLLQQLQQGRCQIGFFLSCYSGSTVPGTDLLPVHLICTAQGMPHAWLWLPHSSGLGSAGCRTPAHCCPPGFGVADPLFRAACNWGFGKLQGSERSRPAAWLQGQLLQPRPRPCLACSAPELELPWEPRIVLLAQSSALSIAKAGLTGVDQVGSRAYRLQALCSAVYSNTRIGGMRSRYIMR